MSASPDCGPIFPSATLLAANSRVRTVVVPTATYTGWALRGNLPGYDTEATRAGADGCVPVESDDAAIVAAVAVRETPEKVRVGEAMPAAAG